MLPVNKHGCAVACKAQHRAGAVYAYLPECMMYDVHPCYVRNIHVTSIVSVRDLRQMVTFWRILACLQRVPFTIVKI